MLGLTRYRKASTRWVARAASRRRKGDLVGAFNHVSRAALAGNAKAQSELADMYRSGTGAPQCLSSSALWLERAALGGDHGAMIRLAKLCLVGYGPKRSIYGVGRSPDRVAARLWAQRALVTGHPEAKSLMALLLGSDSDCAPETVMGLLEQSAAAGDPSACLQLALRLLKTRDAETAEDRIAGLLKVASCRSLPLAVYLFGIANELGFGCARDTDAATRLYEKAASLRFAAAMTRFGTALITGQMVRPRPVEGEAWLRRAAEAGHGGAASIIGALRAGQDGLSGDLDEASNWFGQAALHGDSLGARLAVFLQGLGHGWAETDYISPAVATPQGFRPRLDPASLLTTRTLPSSFNIKPTSWFETRARRSDATALLSLRACIESGLSDHSTTMSLIKEFGEPITPRLANATVVSSANPS